MSTTLAVLDPVTLSVIQITLVVASLITPLITNKRPTDQRVDGVPGIGNQNPADLTLSMRMGYGRPFAEEPVLADYMQESRVNSSNADARARRVTLLSSGAGPIDGGEFELYADGVAAGETIDADDELAKRSLTPVAGSRRRYSFPALNVVEDSVVVFRDGFLYGQAGDDGSSILGDLDVTKRGVTSNARFFGRATGQSEWDLVDEDWSGKVTAEDDDDAYENFKLGFLFPVRGRVDPESVTAILRASDLDRFYFRSNRGDPGTGVVPPDDLHVGRLPDGRWFGYLDSGGWSAGQAAGAKFTIDFVVAPQVAQVVVEDDGRSFLEFFEDQDDDVQITAEYRTSNFDGDIITQFRPGTRDQEELPFENGIRNSFPVGTELVQGTNVAYDSTNEVDDLIVHIQSSPAGMFERKQSGIGAGTFRAAHRKVTIRAREEGAPDEFTTGTDLSAGWVTLKDPDTGSTNIAVDGRTTGAASWFWSIADLLAYLRTGKSATGNSLPRKKYEVQVVATDEAGQNNATDQIFLQSVAEVVRERLRLPFHATRSIEVRDPAWTGRAVRYTYTERKRKVWIPAATAVYSAATGRPEPGDFKWSRNPVWCAVNLVLDRLFGAGEYYQWKDHIHLPSALAAAAYCDELVTNGDGIEEARSEVDIELRDGEELGASLKKIFAGSGVMPVFVGGLLKFVIDEDAPPVMTLTDDDIALGEFKMREPGIDQMPNGAVFRYADEESLGRTKTDTYRVPGTEGERREYVDLEFPAVRRLTQAVRATELSLKQIELQRREVELNFSSWRVLLLEPGDIVRLTARAGDFTEKLFRVMQVQFGSNWNPRLVLQEHNPAAYGRAFQGPSGGVPPGLREPVNTATSASFSTSSAPRTQSSFKELSRQFYEKYTSRLSKLSIKKVSSSWQVDVGSLPPNVRSVRLWYREFGRISWHQVAEDSEKSEFIVDIPHDTDFDVRAAAVDEKGRLSSAFLVEKVRGPQLVADRPDPTGVQPPAPRAKQDGPTIALVDFVVRGQDAKEHEVEVRVSKDTAETKDAWDQGFHEAIDEVVVPIPPDEGNVRVHTRTHRKKDGAKSDWKVTDVPIANPAVQGIEDHSDGFAGGTLEQTDGVDVLEIDSGNLRQKTIDPSAVTVAGNSIETAGDLLGTYWPATYKSETFELGAPEDYQFQFWPEASSFTRQSPNGDELCYPPFWSEDRADIPFDYRIYEGSLEGGEDTQPVLVEIEVATSETSSPTFTDGDFTKWEPGRVYPRVRAYAFRAKIHTLFESRIELDRIVARRWIFCKTRPWCSHADAGELIYHHDTPSGGESDLDVVIPVSNYDELVFEVEWQGGDASAGKLYLDLEADPTKRFEITPAGYNVGTDVERTRFRLLLQPGERQRIVIDSQFEYSSGGAHLDSGTAGRVLEISDLGSSAFNLLRLSTNGSSGQDFAAGSRFRIWGKRHFTGA